MIVVELANGNLFKKFSKLIVGERKLTEKGNWYVKINDMVREAYYTTIVGQKWQLEELNFEKKLRYKLSLSSPLPIAFDNLYYELELLKQKEESVSLIMPFEDIWWEGRELHTLHRLNKVLYVEAVLMGSKNIKDLEHKILHPCNCGPLRRCYYVPSR